MIFDATLIKDNHLGDVFISPKNLELIAKDIQRLIDTKANWIYNTCPNVSLIPIPDDNDILGYINSVSYTSNDLSIEYEYDKSIYDVIMSICKEKDLLTTELPKPSISINYLDGIYRLNAIYFK